MENLAVAILIYIVVVAIAYCPNKTTAVDPVAVPIDYFPDVEEVTETVTDPVVIPEPKAIAITPTKPSKASLSTLIKEEVSKTEIAPTAIPTVTFAVVNDLNKMGVRELYKLAKGNVKGYKSMTKSCLIEALST